MPSALMANVRSLGLRVGLQVVILTFFVRTMMSSLVKLIATEAMKFSLTVREIPPRCTAAGGISRSCFHSGSATVSEVGCGSVRFACVSSLPLYSPLGRSTAAFAKRPPVGARRRRRQEGARKASRGFSSFLFLSVC